MYNKVDNIKLNSPRNRRVFLVLCMMIMGLMMPIEVLAQARIEGRVTCKNKGMEYVNVGVVNLVKPVGTTTDKKGYYDLKVPTRDSLTVRFSMTGYKTVEFRIKLFPGENRILDCEMEEGNMLQEVSISDDKIRRTTFTQIDVEKLEHTVGPSEGVESLLKTLPDVASSNEMSSQYSVRGGSFDENLIYINDVEVYRPMLIRSGEQEGMSIINPDMVDHLMFSPGGFDATYGDRMSSALDITYSRPKEFRAKVSGSLLGASLGVQGLIGNRWTYSLGVRQHSNKYVLGSLDTKGDYTNSSTDVQGIVSFKASEKLDINLMGIWTRNRYNLVPKNRSTDFGNMMEQMHLDIFFDGQEVDKYNTLLGALTFDWRPDDYTQVKWITSAQGNGEGESYDIQGQYWLRQAQVGDIKDSMFDRGVGTYLEHARNYINTRIFNTEVRVMREGRMGNWNFGLKGQYEMIDARLREWHWIDSAGYSVPTNHLPWGDSNNVPVNPMVQQFCMANNVVNTKRLMAFAQRSIDFYTDNDEVISLLIGLRAQLYSMNMGETRDLMVKNNGFLISPRVSVNYQPNWNQDMLFRIAAGMYQQAPFYREFRYPDGRLNTEIKPQTSYQITGTWDWNFKMFNQPFRLTTDIYYKYITNLIPYIKEDLRIYYSAENLERGRVGGISLRLNGELVEGLESWASLSLMRAQETMGWSEKDESGNQAPYKWIPRPTDQIMSFKVFLQDYIPQIPFWRMSLSMIAATGTPICRPGGRLSENSNRIKAYFRVDWGNTVQLSRFEKLKHWKMFRVVDDISLGLEIFNLFNVNNVSSYLWVADTEGRYYGVPNYLTARQINVKLTVTF